MYIIVRSRRDFRQVSPLLPPPRVYTARRAVSRVPAKNARKPNAFRVNFFAYTAPTVSACYTYSTVKRGWEVRDVEEFVYRRQVVCLM